jgi:hypothetical protein
VIGWAFYAAKREAEHEKQKELTACDFLSALKPGALLLRLAQWADARLWYHRVGLQLTFYKRDAVAGQEPIASNVELLMQRLKDFVAVRTKEIQQGPELDDLDVEITPKQRETIRNYCSTSQLEYLCWLHLVSPISERWTRHEVSKAANKKFFDQTYLQLRWRYWRCRWCY